MALSRRRSWSALLPGLLALASTVALALGILLFARVGRLRGETYRLYAVATDAQGIIKGTDVWLAGQKVGVVSGVEIRPVAEAPGAGRVLLALDILSEHQSLIRSDSRVRVQSGGRLIGAPVVSIGVGTPAGRVLADGDTLPGVSQLAVETVRSELAIASRDLPQIIDNMRAIGAHVQRARVDLAASRVTGAGASLKELLARTSDLTTRLSARRGTLGLLARDRDLIDRAQRAVARADSLGASLASARGTVMALPGDSTWLRSLANARDKLAAVRRLLSGAAGSAGRFAQDRALALELERLERQIDSTIADVKRNPARYLAF